MGWTIEEALKDDAIEKTETNWEGWSFWLKGIPTEITVILSVNPGGGYNYSLSHAIKTPSQLGPYHSSRPWGDDQSYALHQAVSSITEYYRQGVKDGHSPSDKWLISNK